MSIKQQQQAMQKIYRNTQWKKWQKMRASDHIYKPKSPIETEYNLQLKAINKSEQSQNSQSTPCNRRSFQQFVMMNRIEKSQAVDLGWLKVGSPHSYCINYSKKKQLIDEIQQRAKFAQKKVIHSRAYQTMSRLKTEPFQPNQVPQYKYQIKQRKRRSFVISQNKKYKTSQCQKQQDYKSPQKLSKKNTNFDGRPWSHFSKQSYIDFSTNKRIT